MVSLALKMRAHLRRQGIEVARCTVERLMRANGWQGVVRAKKVRTTVPDPAATRAPDLVDRKFRVDAPNRIPAAVHSDAEIAEWVDIKVIPEREVWVAVDVEDRVLAVLVLNDGWIDQLYVDPAWIRMGLGSRLIELAKSRSPGRLHLWTFVSNGPARRFYERHGFRVAETTDGSGNEEKAPDLRLIWPAGRA